MFCSVQLGMLRQHVKRFVFVSKQQPVEQFAAGSEDEAVWLYLELGQ